jgi:hypothetical protein
MQALPKFRKSDLIKAVAEDLVIIDEIAMEDAHAAFAEEVLLCVKAMADLYGWRSYSVDNIAREMFPEDGWYDAEYIHGYKIVRALKLLRARGDLGFVTLYTDVYDDVERDWYFSCDMVDAEVAIEKETMGTELVAVEYISYN